MQPLLTATLGHPVVAVRIPMRTGRGQNDREHHMNRSKRVKRERWAVGMVLNTHKAVALPCAVLLMRCSPSKNRLDDDNLLGALKGVRDEVARWLGVDDADERVTWVYGQEHSREWAVVVMAQADEGKVVLQ